MSDIENSVESVEVKPTSKKQITEAQRKARLENLRKGRETRAANLLNKKTKQETKAQGHTYEILESDSDSDSDSSSSDEEELVLSRKSKTKKSTKNPYSEQNVIQTKQKSNEIEELKAMVKQLTKERLKKKKSGNKKTIINVQTPSVTPAKSNNADFYKNKLLEL